MLASVLQHKALSANDLNALQKQGKSSHCHQNILFPVHQGQSFCLRWECLPLGVLQKAHLLQLNSVCVTIALNEAGQRRCKRQNQAISAKTNELHFSLQRSSFFIFILKK